MKIVGSVLFPFTRSRPDLSYAVNYLSLFMQKATQHHLNICFKLLKYIWATKSLTLNFNGHLGIIFIVMVDASNASHHERKSHYGFLPHEFVLQFTYAITNPDVKWYITGARQRKE